MFDSDIFLLHSVIFSVSFVKLSSLSVVLVIHVCRESKIQSDSVLRSFNKFDLLHLSRGR